MRFHLRPLLILLLCALAATSCASIADAHEPDAPHGPAADHVDLEDDLVSDHDRTSRWPLIPTPTPDPGDPWNQDPHDDIWDDRDQLRCAVEYLGDQFTGNRGSRLPDGTLQVVAFYDGASNRDLTLEVELDDGSWITIGGQAAGGPIRIFGDAVETREYRLHGCAPTGVIRIDGVEPNGVIDGLAVGMFWKVDGEHVLVRTSEPANGTAHYVGIWPLGWNDNTFRNRMVPEGFGFEIARTAITGAALVDDGVHDLLG